MSISRSEDAGFGLAEELEQRRKQRRMRRRQPVRIRLEVRDGAARLLDHDPGRRPVPGIQAALVVAVDAPGGEPAQIQRSRPSPPDVANPRKNATNDGT